MSRLRQICSVPTDWTLEDYRRHCCGDGSHHHLSAAEVYEKEKSGLAVFLFRSASRKQKSVVQILPEAHSGPETASYCAVDPINTGLSNRVGEELALAVYRRELWARVMVKLTSSHPYGPIAESAA